MIKRVVNGLVAERIVDAALQEHPPPSMLEVARRVGNSESKGLKQRFPEFHRQVTDRRHEYQKQLDEAVRNCFQSAMSEDPPPTVPELARRLGFKELAKRCGYQTYLALSEPFPEICRLISSRFAAGRKEWLVRAKAQLLSALNEAIPPSIKEMSRRLVYTQGTLYRHFPEECAELSARRAHYIEEETIKRRQQRREEIRRSIIELHNQGIYPSLLRVGTRLSRPSKLSGSFDLEGFREVMSELGIQMTRKWKIRYGLELDEWKDKAALLFSIKLAEFLNRDRPHWDRRTNHEETKKRRNEEHEEKKKKTGSFFMVSSSSLRVLRFFVSSWFVPIFSGAI